MNATNYTPGYPVWIALRDEGGDLMEVSEQMLIAVVGNTVITTTNDHRSTNLKRSMDFFVENTHLHGDVKVAVYPLKDCFITKQAAMRYVVHAEKTKYEFTGDTKQLSNGTTVRRIRAIANFGNVTAGTLGGWIELEYNLSRHGNAWISGDACVFGDAKVFDDALVTDNALVHGEAKVSGYSKISQNAEIFEYATVTGESRVTDNAKVHGKAYVSDFAKIIGHAEVFDKAEIFDSARISGYAKIFDRRRIQGDTSINATN